MLNEIFNDNKKIILILFSFFLIATLAISMINTVNVYKPNL